MSRSSASLVVHELTLAVGPRLLLADVELAVGPGDRLGLVGPNGSGKSTLLRALAGLQPPERGRVRRQPGDATVGYLPQETAARPGESATELLARRTGVADAQAELDVATEAVAAERPGADDRYAGALERWLALGAADFEARAAAVVDELGLSADLLARDVARLSGGQRARVQLAALLLARYDVFLLDEPTNDLDLAGLERLERFVSELTGPVVIVSHDRMFLERTVTGVAEIDEATASLTRYDGGWQSYLDERRLAREHAEIAYQHYVDQRERLAGQARRQREWSNRGLRTVRRSGETDKFIRHNRAQGAENAGVKAKQADRALERLAPVDKPWEGWDLHLQIATAGRSGDVVARLDGAVVERRAAGDSAGDGGFRLGPVQLEVRWGDRVAVVGPNGAGKTTLLDALLGRVPLTSGRRWLGPSVVVGEISQGRDLFADASTLLDGFQRRTGVAAASEARSLLAKFGLGADHVVRSPGSLSPGERTRATLAVLQARGVNLLVLDEPTNHLDLPAIEQLEQAVSDFDGTLILVTHDRRLLDAVACTLVVELDAGQISVRST